MNQWAREHPEQMEEISQLPPREQNEALHRAMANDHFEGYVRYASAQWAIDMLDRLDHTADDFADDALDDAEGQGRR